MKFLVTGAAGFIGSFTAERLCKADHKVIGLDNLNDYYDPNLKLARLERLKNENNFTFIISSPVPSKPETPSPTLKLK